MPTRKCAPDLVVISASSGGRAIHSLNVLLAKRDRRRCEASLQWNDLRNLGRLIARFLLAGAHHSRGDHVKVHQAATRRDAARVELHGALELALYSASEEWLSSLLARCASSPSAFASQR